MKWRRDKSNPKRWAVNHLVNKYGSVCQVCGEDFKKKKDITIDHKQPISKGGADTIDNYQLAHYRCNHLKADMTPEEFNEYQA